MRSPTLVPATYCALCAQLDAARLQVDELQQEVATAKLAAAQAHSRASAAEASATKARLEAERGAAADRDSFTAQHAHEVDGPQP